MPAISITERRRQFLIEQALRKDEQRRRLAETRAAEGDGGCGRVTAVEQQAASAAQAAALQETEEGNVLPAVMRILSSDKRMEVLYFEPASVVGIAETRRSRTGDASLVVVCWQNVPSALFEELLLREVQLAPGTGGLRLAQDVSPLRVSEGVLMVYDEAQAGEFVAVAAVLLMTGMAAVPLSSPLSPHKGRAAPHRLVTPCPIVA